MYLAVGVTPRWILGLWARSYHKGEGEVETAETAPIPGQDSKSKTECQVGKGRMAEINVTSRHLKYKLWRSL